MVADEQILAFVGMQPGNVHGVPTNVIFLQIVVGRASHKSFAVYQQRRKSEVIYFLAFVGMQPGNVQAYQQM